MQNRDGCPTTDTQIIMDWEFDRLDSLLLVAPGQSRLSSMYELHYAN